MYVMVLATVDVLWLHEIYSLIVTKNTQQAIIALDPHIHHKSRQINVEESNNNKSKHACTIHHAYRIISLCVYMPSVAQHSTASTTLIST